MRYPCTFQLLHEFGTVQQSIPLSVLYPWQAACNTKSNPSSSPYHFQFQNTGNAKKSTFKFSVPLSLRRNATNQLSVPLSVPNTTLGTATGFAPHEAVSIPVLYKTTTVQWSVPLSVPNRQTRPQGPRSAITYNVFENSQKQSKKTVSTVEPRNEKTPHKRLPRQGARETWDAARRKSKRHHEEQLDRRH